MPLASQVETSGVGQKGQELGINHYGLIIIPKNDVFLDRLRLGNVRVDASGDGAMSGGLFNYRDNLISVDSSLLKDSDDFGGIYAGRCYLDSKIVSAMESNAARQSESTEDDPVTQKYQVEYFQVTIVRTTGLIANQKPHEIHYNKVTFAYSDTICGDSPNLKKSIDVLLDEIKYRNYSGVVLLDQIKRANLPSRFTLRQERIVRHISRGDTNKTIAASMGISENTVKAHVQNILRRAKAKNRKDLIEKMSLVVLDHTDC